MEDELKARREAAARRKRMKELHPNGLPNITVQAADPLFVTEWPQGESQKQQGTWSFELLGPEGGWDKRDLVTADAIDDRLYELIHTDPDIRALLEASGLRILLTGFSH